MKLTTASRLVALASAAALAFTLGLAPQFVDGGAVYKGSIASAKEKTSKQVKKHEKSDNMTDSDFDNDTDANSDD